MSGREQASLQSVEEMVRLIAELHDLRRRVQRAEAIAPPGGMSPQERRAALLSIELTRSTPSKKSAGLIILPLGAGSSKLFIFLSLRSRPLKRYLDIF